MDHLHNIYRSLVQFILNIKGVERQKVIQKSKFYMWVSFNQFFKLKCDILGSCSERYDDEASSVQLIDNGTSLEFRTRFTNVVSQFTIIHI